MIRPLLVTLLTLPLLAACGGDDADLIDSDFIALMRLPSGDHIATDLPPPFDSDDRLRVTFEGGEVGLQATCNTLSGTAALEDEVLVVGSLGGTEMGCPGAGFEQDEWLVDFFTSRPTVEVLDVGFELRGDTAALRLLPPEAVPGEGDVALEGTRWALIGIEETDRDAVSMTPAPVGASLVIARGRLELHTGCNRGGGDVEIRADELVLRGFGINQAACGMDGARVEAAQLKVISTRMSWSVDGDQLRLSRGDTTLLYSAS